MTTPNLNWIANYIWGIADDVLRDVYVRGKYRDVILPMTVLRRLDAVLEPTKQAVLDTKAWLDEQGIVEQKQTLRDAAGQAFYNTSKFTLKDLRARASRHQLKADFEDYLDGFSPSIQDILDNFEFRNQIPRLTKGDDVLLGSLIEKLTSPDVNLSPDPVMDTDVTVRHPGLDNHGMGTVFEELIRRFNEENNEEAGEHFTPRDAVELMANLVFLPIADEIESGTYLLYDGACGTGGMLTVAEDVLQRIAKERGKQVSTHLYKREPSRTLEEIRADILAVERETEGLLEGLVGVRAGGTGSATASWGAADPWTTGGLAVREPPPRAVKLRIYMDTSVIGGCADEKFRAPSRRMGHTPIDIRSPRELENDE